MTTFLYKGRVTTQRVFKLIEEISKSFNSGEVAVTVLIDSPGGELQPSITLQDFVSKRLASRNLRCINIGRAHSSACILFLAFEADQRYYLPGSDFMFHSAKNSASSLQLAESNDANKISELNQEQFRIIDSSTNLSQYKDIHLTINSGNNFYIKGDDITTWGFAKSISSYVQPTKAIPI